jgi:hypothetical protein
MRLWLRNNSLSVFFGTLFLASLIGQSLAGLRTHNEMRAEHGSPPISYTRYLVSSDFGEAVTENWQSEFLQFTLFIIATVGSSSAARTSRRSLRTRGSSPISSS